MALQRSLVRAGFKLPYSAAAAAAAAAAGVGALEALSGTETPPACNLGTPVRQQAPSELAVRSGLAENSPSEPAVSSLLVAANKQCPAPRMVPLATTTQEVPLATTCNHDTGQALALLCQCSGQGHKDKAGAGPESCLQTRTQSKQSNNMADSLYC